MYTADELRSLPKAELHQHLDGSMRPETAAELANELGIDLTVDDARRRMVAPERCASQAELLTYFDLPISLLQTERALERTSAELVEDLATDGIRYAEIRWAPRLHLDERPGGPCRPRRGQCGSCPRHPERRRRGTRSSG